MSPNQASSSAAQPTTATSEINVPVISVVVISYNTRQMTLECLRTLYADLGDLPVEIFVVDNASLDGSPAAIAEVFPKVRVIANPQNVGFGAANNQAMRLARGEFIMLLNSDAFPKPGAARALVEYLRSHPNIGVVGPKLLNADGSTQQSCYRFPTPGQAWRDNLWISAAFGDHPVLGDYRKWRHDRERTVEWIIGACLLLRREVFEHVGGFDEGFFMYAEETDWQRRIRDAGWEIAFTPAAEVTHVGGASGAKETARVNRHFFESLDRYQYKHHRATGLVSMRLAMILGCSLRALLWSGVALARPARRGIAWSKSCMHLWLVGRQLAHWPRLEAGTGR